LQFELDAWTVESRQNGSVTVGDVTEQRLYGGPIIATGDDDPNNHTKFTSAASEYFK
jgi:hypothetical protein